MAKRAVQSVKESPTTSGLRILLGVTGSIAAWKSLDLVRELRDRGAEVACILTDAASRFVGPLSFETMTGNPVGRDLFDPRGKAALPTWVEGTPAARLPYHLALAECADFLVIAPASAATIARLAQGQADDLLSATVLAAKCRVVVAPAMNTRMWQHPSTQENVRLVRARGILVEDPDHGKMAWDEEGEGPGRFIEPNVLAERIVRLGAIARQLEGRRVVVSLGGTEEPIDAVRSITNRSSGRMGVALAEEARDRGAEVVVVAARAHVPMPSGVRVVRAMTAREMLRAMEKESPHADVVVMAAAVADWRPVSPASRKRKKSEGPPVLRLEPTEDILLRLKVVAKSAIRVGFALETDDPLENGRKKLREKDLDLLVVNDATEPGAGFEVETNRVTILAKSGQAHDVSLRSKREVAAAIFDHLVGLAAKRTAAARTRRTGERSGATAVRTRRAGAPSREAAKPSGSRSRIRSPRSRK